MPSASVEPDPVNATVSGTRPLSGVATMVAAGGWLTAMTSIWIEADLVRLVLSFTVSVAV